MTANIDAYEKTSHNDDDEEKEKDKQSKRHDFPSACKSYSHSE